MWLRLLMQLGELVPHLSRLVPMLERMVSSNRAVANELPEYAADLRSGMDGLTASHRALQRQLADQSVQLASIDGEIKRLRESAASGEQRSALLETRLAALQTWLRVASVLALLMLGSVLFLLLRAH